MKQLLFVLGFLILAAPTAAQEATTPNANIVSFDLDEPRDVTTLINIIAKGMGFDVIIEPPLQKQVTGHFEGTPMAVIRKLVQPFGYTVSNRDETIYVRGQSVASTAAPQPSATPTQPVYAPPALPQPMFYTTRHLDAGLIHVCQLPNKYTVPAIYSPSLAAQGFDQGEWILARNRDFTPCPIQPFLPMYGVNPMMIHTGQAQILPFIGMYGMRGCMNGLSGRVKFKYAGPDSERLLWEVTVNGRIQGSIDQGDAWFNNGLWVCAGPVTIGATKRGFGSVPTREYDIRPGDLTEITIGDFMFEKTP